MPDETRDHVAHASTTINAPPATVWRALTTPEAITQYMMGAVVTSDWIPGSPITWQGEFNGRAYTDKGRILRLVPGRLLEYSHFSPLAGKPDTPENYHTVTVELSADGNGNTTLVSLSQTNNPTKDAQRHSEQNWSAMLDGLKRVAEQRTTTDETKTAS